MTRSYDTSIRQPPLATSILFVCAIAATPAHASIDRQGIDFQGIDFQGIDFQGIDFQGIDFQGIDFQGIDFQGIDFQGIDFQGTLVGQHLDGSELVFRFLVGMQGNETIYATLRGSTITYEFYIHGQESRRPETHPTSAVGAEFEIPNSQGRPFVAKFYRVRSDTTTNSMPAAPSNADVQLYWLHVKNPVTQQWVNPCPSNKPGVFVAGSWDTNGVYSTAGYTFSCSEAGVVAKCIQQWGYKPWKSLPHGPFSVSLDTLFHACTRATMADYCGNGVTHTKANTPIDISDYYGFNQAATTQEVAQWGMQHGYSRLTFVLETVMGSSGTVAHHQERYGFYGASLVCPAGNAFTQYSTQDALWVAAGYFDTSASQWIKPHLLFVRSRPTQWYNDLGPQLNEGLSCPQWGVDAGFCPELQF